MATITRGTKAGGGTNFNAGQTIDPAEVNTDLNTAYTEINGSLDNANIATAKIPGAKSLRFTEITAPASPATDDILLYSIDNAGTTVLQTKDSAGATVILGAVGGAGSPGAQFLEFGELALPATPGADKVRLYALSETPSTRLSTVDPNGTVMALGGVINRDVTVNEVVNTVTETTVYTFSVPANTLGTSRMLRLTLIGDLLNNTGAGHGFTLRVKYGATTIGTVAPVSFSSDTARTPWDLDFLLCAANATNSQVSTTKLFFDYVNVAKANGTTSANAASFWYNGHNSAAEDSTLAKNLDVTIQLTTASASLSCKLHTAILELV